MSSAGALDEEILLERAERAGQAAARLGAKRSRAFFGGNQEYGPSTFVPGEATFMLSAVANEYAHVALPYPPLGYKAAKAAAQRADVESSLGIRRNPQSMQSTSSRAGNEAPRAPLMLTDVKASSGAGAASSSTASSASSSSSSSQAALLPSLSGDLSSQQASSLRSAAAALEQASASARADATPSTTAALVKDALRQGAKEQGLELRSGSDEAATAGSSAAAARAQAQTEAALKRAGAMADAARGASRAMAGRGAARAVPVPQWHAPWKLMRVVTGHTGWVRCAAVDPSNQWYAVGSQDRTVRIYDLASSKLRLTLTGHVSAVRDVVVSERHPYMFTCSEDKQVFCWDLETNTVIRKYFGHTAGVFSLALHPRLDVLFSAGRDSTCRVWDIRTKHQVHCLQGHKDAVVSIGTQAVEPQVITGSMDRTARLWDLAAGKCQGILTHHKRAVRSIACSTRERSFVTAAADGIRKWAGVDVHLERTMEGHAGIVHSAALSDEGVLASAGDDGELRFWDYGTGYCFQSAKAPPQAGSLDSESAVFSLSFDRSGSRLVACGADKTIKVWGEDTEASEETHPIDMRAWQREARKHRRL